MDRIDIKLGNNFWIKFRVLHYGIFSEKNLLGLIADLSRRCKLLLLVLLCGLCLRTERSRDVSSGGVAFSSSLGQMEEAAHTARGYLMVSFLQWGHLEGRCGGKGLATFSLESFWVLNTMRFLSVGQGNKGPCYITVRSPDFVTIRSRK